MKQYPFKHKIVCMGVRVSLEFALIFIFLKSKNGTFVADGGKNQKPPEKSGLYDYIKLNYFHLPTFKAATATTQTKNNTHVVISGFLISLPLSLSLPIFCHIVYFSVKIKQICLP